MMCARCYNCICISVCYLWWENVFPGILHIFTSTVNSFQIEDKYKVFAHTEEMATNTTGQRHPGQFASPVKWAHKDRQQHAHIQT